MSRSPWRVVAVVTVIGAGAAAAVLQSPSGRRQIANSVTRQPTPFTELYFTDDNRIPKVLSVSKPNTVGFTIANHEGKTVDYVYVVTARGPQGTSTIRKDSVSVPSGQLVDESVEFTSDQPGTTYLITVLLSGRSEMIHFTGSS